MPALLLLALVAGQVALSSMLTPFHDYVGHCWKAEIERGTTDQHCIEAVYNGAHVRDRHVVTHGGIAVYAGESVYSDEDGQISFTYWNSLGGVGRGIADAAPGVLTFHLRMRATPDAQPEEVITTWRRTKVGYDVTTGAVTWHYTLDDRNALQTQQ